MTSPTQRSLAYLRENGWTVAITEHWNQWARRRVDLFGIIDILALKDGVTMGVQTTSASNVSARVRKIGESDNIAAIRKAGWVVMVHGWGKKNGRWALREVDVS